MASMKVDPDTDAILAVIKKHESVSVYSLSKLLQWSYGKTERKVADMIKDGKVYPSMRVDGGRSLKMLSLNPAPANPESRIVNGPSVENNMLSDAFRHLHGIFLELNELGIDPTPALFSYAEKHGIELSRLVAMFDNAEQAITT
jgi:hypothetical protein